jgi:hypothetical protein
MSRSWLISLLVSTSASIAVMAGSALAGQSGGTAKPVLTFRDRSGNIEVANSDGKAAAVVVTGSYLQEPTWGPGGDGSAGNPYHVIYAQPLGQLHELDLTVPSTGTPQASNFRNILDTAGAALAPDIVGNMMVFAECSVSSGSSSHVFTATGTNSGDFAASVPVPIYTADPGWTVCFATLNPNATKVALSEYGPNYENRIKIGNSDGTGTWTTVFDVLSPPSGPRFLEWSPVDGILAFSAGLEPNAKSESVYTMVVDATASTPVALPPTRVASPGSNPSWSPDGSQLAYASQTGISLLTLVTGVSVSLVKGGGYPKLRN